MNSIDISRNKRYQVVAPPLRHKSPETATTAKFPATHRGEAEINVNDSTVRGAVVLGIERRVADQQLVHEHAQRPNVYSFIVLLWG